MRSFLFINKYIKVHYAAILFIFNEIIKFYFVGGIFRNRLVTNITSFHLDRDTIIKISVRLLTCFVHPQIRNL